MKISVLFEALTGKFETDTDRASKQFQRQMRLMDRRAAQFGRRLALALSPVALIAITKKSIDFADQIGKTADKLGIGVEALQEFRFAASQAGIQQSTFDMALQRFTRRAAEAAQGTGEAKAVLEEMGIQLTDLNGKLRPTEDLLADVADRLKQNKDPADRLRIAFKLFDSEGVALVNLLRDGSDGLERLRQTARDSGTVMREDLVRNAEKAANKMDELQKVLQVRIAATVTENADSIIELTDSLIKFVGIIGKAVAGWNHWLARQGVGVESLEEIRSRGDKLLEDRLKLEAKLAAIEQSSEIDPFGRFRNALKEQIEEIKAEQLELQNRAITLMKTAQTPLELPDIEPIDLSRLPARLDIGPDPKLVQSRADEIARIIENLRDEVATFGMGDEAALITLVDLNATQDQINAASDLLGQLRALELEDQRREEAASERLALEQEYKSLIESLMTPVERHVSEIERIAFFYEQGLIPSVEEYADAINRATQRYEESQKQVEELDEFTRQAARNMQDAFADFLFDPWEDGLKGMLESFATTLRRMAAEAAAAAIFKKLFGSEGGEGGILSGIFGGSGGGFGNFINSIFGGARARGGPVVAGRPYLVGEQGPEIVVPRLSGTVVPNDELRDSGGGRVINNIFNLPPQATPRTTGQLAYEIELRQQKARARNA